MLVAVVSARTTPATGYELSIYAQTPDAFWVGVGAATAVGLVTSLFARPAASRVLGLVLGVSSYAAVVGLPLLRGYHYFGRGDGMTHLGWTRGLLVGNNEVFSMFYPGIHTFAIFVGESTGLPLTRSLLYVVFAFAVVFALFVPMCAWALTGDLRTTAVATFSGFLLLPITNISTQLVPHTTTQTVLFAPVVVYLLVRYLRSDRGGTLVPTGAGTLLAVALAALVVYHPQQALNFLLMLATICGLQLVARRWISHPSVTEPRRVYAQTGFLAVFWMAWSHGHERFRSGATNAVGEISKALTGGGGVAADTAQRGGSLTEIGSGLFEIFLKIFSVAGVYSAVTAALLLVALFGRLGGDDDIEPSFHRYMAGALVPVAALFGLYVLGSVSTQAFRHLGFLLVFVTLVGAVGIGRGWRLLSDRLPRAPVGSAVAVFLAVAIVVSALTVFPSPWIYLPSQHVSEQSMSGYETTFEHATVSDGVYSVRGDADRFADAHYARKVPNTPFGSVNETAMRTSLSTYHGTGWYLAVSEADRKREVLAYDQLRYSRESFALVRTQRGVSSVVDNGGFELYYVSG
ncbi:MFS transporter [Halosimplex carlsbadense]|uniref:MFS transporter n=1 Tax=Halosimplex carlsbadense TaxID=171164 RepID=UPI001268B2D3|nr:MFS transporter [Halosimplex carlsbadense]